MEIKAVVFDWDGTLLDTKIYWHEENRKWLKFALSRQVTEDQVNRCWGVSFKNTLKSYGVSQEKIDFIIKERDKEFEANFHMLRLFPKIQGILEKLKENRIKIGILSNNRRHTLEKSLEYFDVLKFFDIVVGDEFSRKPDPAGLLKAVETFGLKKENVLYVGDTPTDRQTAENAGMKCLIVGVEIKSVGDLFVFLNKQI